METIALSLVSHTNVGKTTLARTLLRRDVGTVFDQAHVTDVAEAWPLIETEAAKLLLWDTPGFGDTARLMKRLKAEGNAVGWFLHQVWDRVTDRPLWCGQEAMRNVRQDADVVLYLVNAAELPEEAAYVDHELDLLGWLGRPVLVLLNQTGHGDEREHAELARRWADHTRRWSHVRGLLPLDAFTRSWVQEHTLLERVSELLPAARRSVMSGLIRAWNGRNLAVLERAVAAVATLLVETAADSEAVPSGISGGLGAGRKRAQSALVSRLETRLKSAIAELVDAHGLDGRAAGTVRERVEDFAVSGLVPVGEKEGALWGAVLSGAATGVTAEVLSGGLTFGAGALLGALAGALGGAGLIKGLRVVKGGAEPTVRWEAEFLEGLTRRGLLTYLAVAQFGRGQGAFDQAALDAEHTAWSQAVDAAVSGHERDLAGVWRVAADRGSQAAWPAAAERVDRLAREVLVARHPDAAGLLRLGPERRA